MYCETTLNIKKGLLQQLNESAEILGISRSRLVSILLLYYMDRNNAGACAYSRLRYQERNSDDDYCAASICFRGDVYERWCDVRKLFKLSASFVIALAVDLYLDEIMNGEELPFNNGSFYATNSFCINNMHTSMVIWGYPEEETLKRLTET